MPSRTKDIGESTAADRRTLVEGNTRSTLRTINVIGPSNREAWPLAGAPDQAAAHSAR